MTDNDTGSLPVNIPVGDIDFFDNFIPSVDPGHYTISVVHEVSGGTPAEGLMKEHQQPPVAATSFTASQDFQVQGSRFVLDPSEIHAVFPPSGTNGMYEQRLAQIVLNKRALPWEHPLGTKSIPVDRSVPWLALLVVTPDELTTTYLPRPAHPGQPNPTRSATLALKDVLGTRTMGSPAATIVGPTLTLSPWEDPDKIQVQVIDMPVATFQIMVPNFTTAPLLSHVREVHMGDKPELGLKDSGWFSLVVNNRLPVYTPAHPGDTNPNPYIAHLVSIEGFAPYLKTNPRAFPTGNVFVRMISLASWTFGVKPEGISFSKLMNNLLTPASEQGTGWLLRLPQTPQRAAAAGGDPSNLATFAARVMAAGYTPMAYQTRVGEQTFGWYRGPLSPVPVTPYLTDTPPRTAAEAIVYDSTRGIFDLSYGVAFQTGRLVALSSSSFSVAMLDWRRQLHAVVDKLIQRCNSTHLQNFSGDTRPLTERSVEELRTLLEPAIPIQDHFKKLLVGDFAKHVAPRLFTSDGDVSTPVYSKKPVSDIDWPRAVQEAMASPAVKDLLQSTPELIPANIVTWLAKRVLLNDIPFNNLVPDANMLPEESIRFFYVDENWLQALIDGALSVGAQSFRDTMVVQSMRQALISAVAEKAMVLRDPSAAPTTTLASLPSMTGMLLRSSAVTGYRALQVKGFSDTNNGTPVQVLRLVELSTSVLLALFSGIPKVVAIDEPREGLGFGVEDGNVVELRYVSGNNVGMPFPNSQNPLAVPVSFIGDSHQIDIQETLNAIRTQVAPHASQFGPADLALNMVHLPEQMLWEPHTGIHND